MLEAVCILKGIKPIRMKDTNTGQMVDNYWEASKKMLMEDDFLGSLRQYDKDHIDAGIIKKIQPYIANPEFQPEKILTVCLWVVLLMLISRSSACCRHTGVGLHIMGVAACLRMDKPNGSCRDTCSTVPVASFPTVWRNLFIYCALLTALCCCVPLQVSRAAYGLCCWVRAMDSYDRVAKVVEPKRKRLQQSEEELEVRNAQDGV